MEKKIEKIIERLGNVHHEERIAALKDLSGVKDELAKDLLAEALADKHAEVRKAAMNIIAGIDPDNLEVLLGMLNDPDSEIRRQAMERIQQKGSCLKGMIESLKQSNQPERIILAIGVCGETGDSESIDYLVKMLTHNSSEVRNAAKETILKTESPDCKKRLVNFILAEIEDSSRSKLLLGLCDKRISESAEEIMACLEDRFWKIRCSAAQALGELKYEPSIEGLKNLTQDHNAAVRYYSKKALNQLGVPFKKWSITDSVKAEASPSVEISMKSKEKPDKSKEKPIAKAASNDVPQKTEPVAEKSVKQTKKDLLQSDDPKIRMECLDSLDLEDIKGNIDLIGQMIKGDSSEIIRSKAITKAALYKCEKTSSILNGALKDSDYRVRANAIEGIEKTGGEEAIMILTPLLMDEDNRIRTNAAKALHALGDSGIEKKLVNLLKNGEAWMRDSAAYMINEVGSKAVLDDLFEVFKTEKEKDVAEKIISTIEKFAAPDHLSMLYGLKSDNSVPHAAMAGILFEKMGLEFPDEYKKIITETHPEPSEIKAESENGKNEAQEPSPEKVKPEPADKKPESQASETGKSEFKSEPETAKPEALEEKPESQPLVSPDDEIIELDLLDDQDGEDTLFDMNETIELDLTDNTQLDLTDNAQLDLTDNAQLDLTDNADFDLTEDVSFSLDEKNGEADLEIEELDFTPGESEVSPPPAAKDDFNEQIDLEFEDFAELDFQAGESSPEPSPSPAGTVENEVLDLNLMDESMDLDFENLEITPEATDKRQEGADLPPMALPAEDEDKKDQYNEELSLDFESLDSGDLDSGDLDFTAGEGTDDKSSAKAADPIEDALTLEDLEMDVPVEPVKEVAPKSQQDELETLDLDFDTLEMGDSAPVNTPSAEPAPIDGPGLDSSVEIDDAMIDSLFADDLGEDTNTLADSNKSADHADDFAGDADLDDLSKLLDENL